MLLLATAYWVAHKLGYLLRVPPADVVLVWPAVGVALGGLLITRPSERWKLALVLVATNLVARIEADVAFGLPPALAVANLLNSVLEAGLYLLIFRASSPSVVNLATTTQVGALIVAATFGAAVSSIFAAAMQHLMLDLPFFVQYVRWWASSALGLLLVTPAVIVLAQPASSGTWPPTWSRRAESLLFLTVWTAAALEIFHVGAVGPSLPMPYVLVALLAWAASRLGMGTVAASFAVLAGVIANSPLIGNGPSPLGGSDPATRVVLTQLFLAVISSTGLLLCASRRETVDALAVAHQQRRRVESLADNLPGGAVFQIEFRGGGPRFGYVSAGVGGITGTAAEAFRGHVTDLFTLVHPDDASRLATLSRAPGDNALPGRVEFRLIRPDGEVRSVVLSYSPGRLSDGSPAWDGILVDVSEQRRSEEALRQSEIRLLEAQKMEMVGQLAGGVAHDFNNLLTVVIGYADMLANIPADDEVHQSAGEIVDAATRASALTQQLLAYGRRTLLSPRVLDLNIAVARLVPIVRRTVGESITVELELATLPLTLRVDPVQLERVCLNLILNARDAMPHGGRLCFVTGVTTLGDERAVRHGVSPGDYVWVAVHDTGTGMSDAVRARLFEPFFTTKPFGRGSGMGLAAVHGVVRQSQGFIEVESAVGQGSRFTIFFPRHAGELAGVAVAETARPTGSETILLVEDTESVRDLIERILRHHGYTVWTAATSEHAERLMADAQTCPALIVTDVVMPGTGGVELVARLRRDRPGLRALFISGYSDDAVLLHGLETGRADFLHKPFSPAVLAERVRRMLDDVRDDGARAPVPAA